jgi:hypothetical protein
MEVNIQKAEEAAVAAREASAAAAKAAKEATTAAEKAAKEATEASTGVAKDAAEVSIKAAEVPIKIFEEAAGKAGAKLAEEKADADLLRDEHRFGFSEPERDAMIRAQLYESEHIGSTIRRLSPVDPLTGYIMDSAMAEVDVPEFNMKQFMEEYGRISHPDPHIREGVKFSSPSREFLRKVLEHNGYLDVRRILRLGDFVFSRDGMYFVTALTPNKWAPLQGIRAGDGKITTDSLFAGGSQAMAIVEVESVEI